MIDAQALLTDLYAAYNRRDFAAFSDLTHEEIDWPNELAGTRLKGREAVRTYLSTMDQIIKVDVTPLAFKLCPDGRIGVDVNLVVHGLKGGLWSDIHARRYYTLRDGLVWRMDIADLEHLNETP